MFGKQVQKLLRFDTKGSTVRHYKADSFVIVSNFDVVLLQSVVIIVC